MLTPKYLSDCPENLIELYAQLEADILSDMARKIKAYDVFSSSVNWQKDRVRLMGEVYEEILKQLSAATGKTVSELKAILQDAGIKTLAADDEIYRAAGKKITPLDASKSLQSVLSVGLTKTANSFANLTKTTAKNGSRQFVEALDRAYMQVTSGAFDTNTAVRNAIKDLAGQGIISIRYKNRTDTIETAVRRAVVTGVSQTCGMLQEARADEMDCDLVEVTAHAGARPSHAEWQGKIYSRSGSHPDYPSLTEATGYGTAAGLKGVNCRHDFYPFIEGVSEPAYSSEELKEYKESKDYTYNGEELTEYEATQKQRYIERQLRKYKRQQQALKAAGFPEDDAAAKVKHWNVVQEDFIRQTGLKRQYDREEIGKEVAKTTKSGIIKQTKIANIKRRGALPPEMEEERYKRMVSNLQKQGVSVLEAKGDNLAYLKVLGAEATVSGTKTILHMGRIPSASALFEEIIHLQQCRAYGELTSTNPHELYVREILANRKLLKHKRAYDFKPEDIEDIETNLARWQEMFKNFTGVEFDESGIDRKI